jgi:hypothetical protein
LLLVEGYALAGQVLPSSYFIGDCQVHGVFRTHPYPVPTHAEAQAALNELVSSAAWKALPWRESNSPEHAHDQQNWKIAFLQKQVDRVP